MNRHLKTILFLVSFALTKPIYSQSNSDSLIFLKLSTVYKSNLIDFSGDLLMLKFRTIPNHFTYDGIFCDLSKGKFRSSMSINDNDIIDSLSKMFFIYKVEFDKSQSGQIADSILTKSNHYAGYLIPLQEDRGVVTHYIIQRWTQKFNSVKYKVTNFDCNNNNQCCVVMIESLR
jgi:hypothetical protein